MVKDVMNRFVVHQHQASHLHWDFRLEMTELVEGGKVVLKSWAVPKGVPTKPGERRLAVATPDHDVSYINFEGQIAEGRYGGGTVKIWDSGTYVLKKRTGGKIRFTLRGEKLSGSYVIFHPETFKKGQFLFLKHKD